MESKDSMFEVHAHEDESGEIDLGRGAASGDDRMVSPMAAIDHMYENKNQPSGKIKIKRKMWCQVAQK